MEGKTMQVMKGVELSEESAKSAAQRLSVPLKKVGD